MDNTLFYISQVYKVSSYYIDYACFTYFVQLGILLRMASNIFPSEQFFLHSLVNNTCMLTNNDILKKLRVALSLTNDDIIKILALEKFNISKGALGDLFRADDHPNYVEAGDQILRNFLNGLITYKRGPRPALNEKQAKK